MPRRLVVSPEARRDLQRAVDWQTQPGAGRAASRRLAKLRASIEALIEHPCRCRRIGGVRLLVVARHRVIYRVAPDTGRDETAGDVLILRVLGPGQMT